MIIAGVYQKCKDGIGRVPRDVLGIAVLVLAASFSFGLGYLAGLDAGRISTISLEAPPASSAPAALPAEGQVVASKNGTKYYPLGCAGADRISSANKVYFASAAAAAAAGYAPAANCTRP